MTPIDSDTSAYIRRVNALPSLSREEELALAARYAQHGDLAASRRVITANLRHVVPVALRYRRYGVPVEELIAEGNLAISRALKGFDAQRGLRFATYANYWIRADILALILRQRSLVGGGRGQLRPKYFFRLRREHARLALLLADPSAVNEALAVRWKLSTSELEQILHRCPVCSAARWANVYQQLDSRRKSRSRTAAPGASSSTSWRKPPPSSTRASASSSNIG
jgi:RNA polymerase sigma-32 factor